jgi:hypothetical protein
MSLVTFVSDTVPGGNRLLCVQLKAFACGMEKEDGLLRKTKNGILTVKLSLSLSLSFCMPDHSPLGLFTQTILVARTHLERHFIILSVDMKERKKQTNKQSHITLCFL